MTEIYTPARYIREQVFRFETQDSWAREIGYSQAQISRFESDPDGLSVEAQKRIRAYAKRKREAWDNDWFFEVPSSFLNRLAQDDGRAA